MTVAIRKAKASDLPDLARVAEGTKMFLAGELESFVSVMKADLEAEAQGKTPTARLIVAVAGAEVGEPVIGAAYFSSEGMAQGVMNLLFIGVAPEARGKGAGQALLDAFEESVRETSARLAIIETASDAMFAPAWALYKKNGYEEEARIRDFYDDGLDKLVFRKKA